MAKEWAIGTGILFATTTMARMATLGKRWRAIIPGGVAVAVGKYFIAIHYYLSSSALTPID